MRTGLLDLPSGISGDMLLGALVGAGAPLEDLRKAVRAAGGDRLDLRVRDVDRAGLRGTRVEVLVEGRLVQESGGPPDGTDPTPAEPPAHEHRSFRDIVQLLERAALPPSVRARALEVFRRLAEAEGAIHGVAPDDVHFHEVGAWDAIADVVGAAAGLLALGITRLYHGPIALGGGLTESAHGPLPVPAPATLRLLAGRECVFEPGAGELTTPTGAALLAVLAEPAPLRFTLHPERVGYGAGRRDPARRANVARLTVGTPAAPASGSTVAVIEAALDDCPPEEAGFLLERLLEAGALDVTLTPLIMKKSRPGFLVRVIARAEDAAGFARQLTLESPSLGARWRLEERLELERRVDEVQLADGLVRVKVAMLPGGGERPHPEHEDVARIARARGVPLAHVRREVERRWSETR